MKSAKPFGGLLATLAGIGVITTAAPVHADADALRSGFEHPPAVAKPRVWWHWMNGNITLEGIHKDLQWMHRVGVGGANIIDASIDTPQVVQNRRLRVVAKGDVLESDAAPEPRRGDGTEIGRAHV